MPFNTNSKQNFTKAERSLFVLSKELKEITIGLLLGDVNMQKRKWSVNPVLRFVQGLVHKDYLLHLYGLFDSYCKVAPKITIMAPHKRTGIRYSCIHFNTYSLPCFNELYELFYPLGVKSVPLNIGELLTPLSLAYWISDDGNWDKIHKNVVLCTNSFTLVEVELLVGVLNNKFDLKAYKCKHTSGYVIKIPSYSVGVLQYLLEAHMPPMMRHKIGLPSEPS